MRSNAESSGILRNNMGDLAREFGRKAFHMLSLAYGIVFYVLGWPRAAWALAAWLLVVFFIELARLRVPAFERALVNFFEGMIRDSERRHFSGIIYTTAGSLGAMLLVQGNPVIVYAVIGQLSFGDAAAALVGKAFGKTKIAGGPKSWEGSLACLAVCYAAAVAVGVPAGPALASAIVATLVELKATAGLWNDNFWLPMASAAVLLLLGVR